ncbi:CidA/LrgA family protein [Pseudomonas sp. PD9R]|uniref:CidA/LrgA family protein n=1 Tax=Pseudomonas sp. PD9R TaxID=2853534 RepID=UPI001C4583F4|nr:CidA/LrgA family protein [Pseudomonas sp. PD9R]MBV6823633.1 CidA/LrgA family protein [Pseudomonas sp. PD9R]
MFSATRLTDPSPAMKWVRVVGQVLLLSVIWFVADRGAKMLELPISGGIFGLGILVVLLLTGVIKPGWIEGGAELILANMLLYFIPLVVSVVQYTDLLEAEGLKLMLAIGIGFVSVLLITAFVVEWICQLIRKRQYRNITEARRNRAFVAGQK